MRRVYRRATSAKLGRSNFEGGLSSPVESRLDKLTIIGEEIRVGVQRQRCGLVPKHRLNSPRICASTDGERGRGVIAGRPSKPEP
jgi:hypothetical protein